MPTTQKINIYDDIRKLGIIAGGGDVPSHLIDICKNKNIIPYIIGFKGQTAPNIIDENDNGIWLNIGSAGKIISFFKSNDVKALVLIGHMKRPSLSEIKPDIKAMKILSKISFKSFGDNSLLTALKEELEAEGFKIYGFNSFCDDWIVKEGNLGKITPIDSDKKTIDAGIKISQAIGELDIGQSIIMQDGIVIGVEAVEGTDELIRRCKPLIKKGRGGILIKTCKPNQDRDLDLPTMGIKTVENARNAGLVGIVIEAKNAIIVEPDEVIEYADKCGIFILGVRLS